jgi:hypothetical protein
MPSSGMLCRVDLVRTDVSEERSASFIRVTRVGELGTTLVVTSNRCIVTSENTAFFSILVLFDSRQGKYFHSSISSRPDLEQTQSPIKSVWRTLSHMENWPWPEDNLSLLTSADVKKS